MSLVDRHCVVPLPKGTPKLTGDALAPLLAEVPSWEAKGDRLVRTFMCRDFAHAMKFVNALAVIAEAEDHHPDFTVRYNRVEVSSWTHTVDGLSENDFILAAKLSRAWTDERG